MDPEVWGKLPSELLAKVQLRLPAIEIARLRRVSRDWNALFNDARFASRHRHYHSICCYEDQFLLSCDSTPKCSFDAQGHPFFEVKNAFQLWLLKDDIFHKLPSPEASDIPESLPCRYLRACGPGVALILAYDTDFRRCGYFIWQPLRAQCESVGNPRMWALLLDGIVVDEETLHFVVITVGRLQPDDKLVSTLIFDSEKREDGWTSVDCSFPCVKFDRIRGPLSCSKKLCSCSWIIEEATEREERYRCVFFAKEREWSHEQVEKEVEWIHAPACGQFEPVISGLKRNNLIAITAGGAGDSSCVLSGLRKVFVKSGKDAEWKCLKSPDGASAVFANLLAFNLVL